MIRRKFCSQCSGSHRAAIELQEKAVLLSTQLQQAIAVRAKLPARAGRRTAPFPQRPTRGIDRRRSRDRCKHRVGANGVDQVCQALY